MLRRRTVLGSTLLVGVLAPAAARAHHGWSWTTGENIELTGTIREARLGNPHGELDLDVEGTVWTVEIGQPWRNERAGLSEGDLAVGRTIRVSGEPASDPGRKLLKAERLWIDGVEHELYPDRD